MANQSIGFVVLDSGLPHDLALSLASKIAVNHILNLYDSRYFFPYYMGQNLNGKPFPVLPTREQAQNALRQRAGDLIATFSQSPASGSIDEIASRLKVFEVVYDPETKKYDLPDYDKNAQWAGSNP